MQEGQTATNPTTGEKVVLRGGQWVPMPAAAPAGQPRVGFIPGVPRPPPQRAPQTPTEAAIDEEQLAALRRKAAKESGAGSAEQKRQEAQAALAAIKSARENIGWTTTGLPGQILGNVGGSGAIDLKSQIDTVRANLAFDRLQAMRDASPTGGALGSITERELTLLQSTLANLDPAQSQKQLAENLDRVELHYLNFLNSLEGKQPATRLDEAREVSAGIRLVDGGPTELTRGDEPQGIQGPRLTPEQEQELKAFYATKPSAAEINAKWRSFGFGDMANADKIAAALREGRPVGGVSYELVDEARRRELEREAELGSSESAPMSLVTQGMTLGLSDEAAGIGRGLSRAIQLRDPIEGYRLGRDAHRLRLERAREKLGWGGTALEIGGGLLSANPRGALAAITSRWGTIKEGAKAGAYGGALAGYGYGEGLEDSAGKSILGGAFGGAVGAGISTLASRGGGGPSTARIEGPPLLEAARRQGVDINAANVRPGARNMLSYFEASPGSSGIVQRNLADQAQQIEGRAATLGAEGAPLTTDVAGEAVRASGLRYKARTKAISDRLYDRATTAAGDAKVAATNAVETIKAKIATLSETPGTNKARIEALTDILQDLVGPDGNARSISVQGLRDMRTGVRTSLKSKGLTMTQAEGDAMDALSAISDDLAAGLQTQAPDAARMFRRADGFYRDRAAALKQIQEVIGGRDSTLSGEKIFARLQALASPRSGDGGRLATVIKTLEPEERADLAATIAESMGRRSPEEPFSPALFASQARQLSPKTRTLFFGKEGEQCG